MYSVLITTHRGTHNSSPKSLTDDNPCKQPVSNGGIAAPGPPREYNAEELWPTVNLPALVGLILLAPAGA